MSHIGIPFEGYNSFYAGNSYNQLMMNFLNPYGVLTQFQVTITFPVFEGVEGTDVITDEDAPNVTVADFLVWARSFKEFLDQGEDSIFYPLFYNLMQLAKISIRYSLIRQEDKYTQLVCLYTAHYMELLMQAYKDESNRVSLNPYEKDKDYKYEVQIGDVVFEEFKSTIYGRIFWQIYKPYGERAFWGLQL